MRGLKHFSLNRELHGHEVASFTDAWIETKSHPFEHECKQKSHLLQMRGLKRSVLRLVLLLVLSHLLQMRGLKHKTITLNGVQQHVASFTDAWIETHPITEINVRYNVASFTDAWIETLI